MKCSTATELVGAHLDFIVATFPFTALLFESGHTIMLLIDLGALGEHLQGR